MGFNARKLLIVGNHPVTFGGHRYCDNRDKMVLIYLVASRDHMLKGLFELMC